MIILYIYRFDPSISSTAVDYYHSLQSKKQGIGLLVQMSDECGSKRDAVSLTRDWFGRTRHPWMRDCVIIVSPEVRHYHHHLHHLASQRNYHYNVRVTAYSSTGLVRFQVCGLSRRGRQRPCVWEMKFKLSLHQWRWRGYNTLTRRPCGLLYHMNFCNPNGIGAPKRGGRGRRAAASSSKVEKQRFCRHEDIEDFMWFTLQPKSATEIGWWLVGDTGILENIIKTNKCADIPFYYS